MNNHEFARSVTGKIATVLHREHSHDLTFSQGNAIIAIVEGELDKISAGESPTAGPAQRRLGFSEPRTPTGPAMETKTPPTPRGGVSVATRKPATVSKTMGDQGRMNLIFAGIEGRSDLITRREFVARAKGYGINGSGKFFDACVLNGRLRREGSITGTYSVIEVRPLIARRVRDGLKGGPRRLGQMFRVSASLAREAVDAGP